MTIRKLTEELDDLSPMPFGIKYRNIPMQDVPVTYLHWIWHNVTDLNVNKPLSDVKDYIKKNLHALKEENKDLIWD